MATAIAFIVWVLLIACPTSYDCRAIPRRSMRVVMGSGLDQARSFPRLLRIQCGFVSFAQLPLPVCPVPSHPPRSHACFALIVPLIALMLSPSITRGRLLRFSRPYRLPPITPRLFVSSERGGFPKGIEFDAFTIGAMGRLIPTACLPSCGFRAARRLISSSHRIRLAISAYRYPIPSRCMIANGAAAPITPRQSPRPSCRRTGRIMCLDVMRSIPWICDSRDGRGAFALSSSIPAIHLIHLIISSHLFPRPTPSPRLSLVCLL